MEEAERIGLTEEEKKYGGKGTEKNKKKKKRGERGGVESGRKE